MRQVSSCTVAIFMAALSFAQTESAKPASTPTFRSSTELVTVPVVVTRGGKYVTGLPRDAFAVTEDGKPRPLASFEEITARKEPLKEVAVGPGIYTNALVQEPGPVGLTIILLDVLNTPALVQANARQNIVKFLSRNIQTNEPTMLVLLGRDGMKVVHDFTTDSSILVAALKRVSSMHDAEHVSAAELTAENELKGTNAVANPINPTREGLELAAFVDAPATTLREALAADQKERARMTMELMGNLARAVIGIQGRKTLIWATGDIPCTAAAGGTTMFDMAELCEQTWNALSAANIAIYPVELGQTSNPVYASPQYANPVTPNYPALQDLFEHSFAEYTGGSLCTFRTDLDTCFRHAVEDSEQYYLLSYYAEKKNKPGWRKIHVQVNADHVKARARSGYYTLGKAVDADARRKLDMAWASFSPIDYTGVTMAVRWTESQWKDGRGRQGFELHADSHALTIESADSNHMKLDIAAVAHDASGGIAGDVNQTLDAHLSPANLQKLLETRLTYINVLELPAGSYSVKFIVRDELSGRMGSVTAPLTVRPPQGQ